MFSGMSNHSIDAKGRIILPAKFREELGDSFYLAGGFDNCCIQAMSAQRYDEICSKILELPANLAIALQYKFNATAVEVTPNAQGRVIIPQTLRDFAELGDNAIVIGMNNRLEIWNKQKFDEYMASQQSNVTEALSMLRL
ncbi:MAG: division/cell wall cluster transcriptional repressor MraZ [Clostridiales bacterium]|nr:division/cell wall cluster transcriptional repressor MraZ [Clostridiales bacterium]